MAVRKKYTAENAEIAEKTTSCPYHPDRVNQTASDAIAPAYAFNISPRLGSNAVSCGLERVEAGGCLAGGGIWGREASSAGWRLKSGLPAL